MQGIGTVKKMKAGKAAHVANDEMANLLEAVVEHFPGGLLLFDKSLRLAFYNQKQKELLEYSDALFKDGPPTLEDVFWFNARRGEYGPGDPAELVAARMELVRKRVEHIYERTRPNGSVLLIKGQPLPSGGFLTIYLDVTEQRKGQEAIAYLATHDVTTGLPNRAALQEQLSSTLALDESKRCFALLFIDLDGFKAVNDSLGHTVGDMLLRHVGNRIRQTIRDTDFVSRHGGDEFVVMQRRVTNHKEVENLAARIRQNMTEAFDIEGNSIHIGLSIGTAIYGHDGSTFQELIAHADKMMYVDKTHIAPEKDRSAVTPSKQPKRA